MWILEMPMWFSVIFSPMSWAGLPKNWLESFVPEPVSFPAISRFRAGSTENYFFLNPHFMPIPSISIRFRLLVYVQVKVVCIIPSDLEFVMLDVVKKGKIVIIDGIVGLAQT
jgi:hypothetical protein